MTIGGCKNAKECNMMMRKRAVAAFAVIIGALLVMSGLTGCGGDKDEDNPYWPLGYIEETLDGGFVVWNHEDGTRELYEYTGNETVVTIPSGITKIGPAFQRNTSITKVTIPDSVTVIGSNAFWKCTSLTDVNIPESVTIIESYAFAECKGLERVSFPASLTTIGGAAFSECTGLTSIVIPDSVTTIEPEAFRGPYEEGDPMKLNKVVLGKGLKTMGRNAFENCGNIETVEYNGTLKEWLEADKDYSLLYIAKTVKLEDLDNLKKEDLTVTLPAGITKIGGASFSCTTLATVTIPASVKSIGNHAFASTKLTSVTLPSAVTSIGDYAFNMTGLTSLPDLSHITSIGEGAFCYTKIKEVTIPASVKSVDLYAFKGCSEVTKVTIEGGLTQISNNMFEGCYNLKEITIPDTVTEIGDSAFMDCSGLESITIPASVKYIGRLAFVCHNETKLESVKFTDPNNWYAADSRNLASDGISYEYTNSSPIDSNTMSNALLMAQRLADATITDGKDEDLSAKYGNKCLYKQS